MYDPKEVLTKGGHIDLIFHLRMLEEGLMHLKNNIDDLHIGSLDERQETLIYEMEEMLSVYKTGDGEKYTRS